MRNLKTKILPLLLAFALIFSIVPMSVGAQGVSVSDEQTFRDAVANGGEIVLTNNILLTDTVYITKDTVIDLGSYFIELVAGYVADSALSISGADVTIKCINNTGSGVHYNGKGSTYKLEAVGDADTSLTIIGGGHLAREGWDAESAGFAYPKALLEVVTPAGVEAPSIVISDANCSCSIKNPETNYPYEKGALISGDDSGLVIKSGSYYVDISEYVAEGSAVLDDYGSFKVLEVATEYSDKFASILNKNGNVTVNRYKPETEMDFAAFYNSLYYKYGEEGCEPQLSFYVGSYDYEEGTIYASLVDENGNATESHKIKFEFIYDEKVKTEIDELVSTLPEGEDMGGGFYMPYIYKVTDLEVINYWLTGGEGIDNTNALINYSDEFKKYIGYKNFKIEAGAGDADFFYTFAEGDTDIGVGETVYASVRMGVQADHVIYVPDETENTADAIRKAAQKRIDDYIGKDRATLIYNGTVYETLDEGHFDAMGVHLDPNMDFEAETGIAGVTGDDHCFTTEINGVKYYIIVLRDSKKMVTPTYKNVDVATNVTVLTEDSSVPLDTLIAVDKLSSGEEYDRIMKALDVNESETYDISLYSQSADKNITKLDNGKFEVKIPVSEKFKGKELKVYYVDANGKTTEHDVTVADGYATFVTDHFSAYTLAAIGTLGGADNSVAVTPTVPNTAEKSPLTGSNMAVILVLLVLSSGYIFANTLCKKRG
ncbi:MAG: hypothetical protein IJZ75_01730 [Clostridia bacterium]|nr:hypothetical protein [Clostridia bacterium]